MSRSSVFADMASQDVTAAELNKLDGVTVTTAQINAPTTLGTVTSGNISNTAIVYPAGHILQTVTAFEAGEMSTSSTATPGATLGLSVAITPTAATNKILISCTLGLVSIDGAGASIAFNIHSSLASGVIKVGTASSARVGALFRAGARINNDGNHNWGITFNVVDTPTTWSSGAITYTLYAWGESTTVYVGRSDTNSNVSDAYGAMCSSTMLAQEIKV